MAIFGLTGDLSSGKSTVLKILRFKGAIIFDSDKVVHDYYRKNKGIVYKTIALTFPEVIKKRSISRKILGNIVFSDRVKLRELEKIVHPAVKRDLLIWIKNNKIKEKICVAEVPLLFEKKLDKYFKEVILVTTNKKILIERIVAKYNLSKAEALERLKLYILSKDKKEKPNFVINNSSSLVSLKKEVNSLWEKIKLN